MKSDKSLPELWGINMHMTVYRQDGKPLDHDEFMDKFIAFVESNNWYCGGSTYAEDLNHPDMNL